MKTVDFFLQMFNDTGVKPVLMEYEKWSRNNKPNWFWIKNEIQKSAALFLVLTKNIVKKEYTQNWVAFEVGVASNCNPSVPVFVFKEQNIDFPVPYVNHYFDQSLSNTQRLYSGDFSLMLLNVLFHGIKESFIKGVITGSFDLPDEGTTKCSKCLLSFHYWGYEEEFNCPCCSATIVQDMSEFDR
jgi:hypothetical protein